MNNPTGSSPGTSRGLREAFSGLLIGVLSVATLAAAFVLSFGEAGELVAAVPTVTQKPVVVESSKLSPTPMESEQQPTPPTPIQAPTTAVPAATVTTEPIAPATEIPEPTYTATTAQKGIITETGCGIPAGWIAHTVQSGETMFSLAQHAGTNVASVQDGNCLAASSLLSGQVIYLPLDVPVQVFSCGPPSGWGLYSVQAGDTLFNLSLRSGTTVSALQRANCLDGSTGIQAGLRIYIPPGLPTPTSEPSPTADSGPTPIAGELPVISFATTSVIQNEGNGVATINVIRSGALGAGATVSYSLTPGSATAGADYTGGSGAVIFGPAENSQNITIPLVNDSQVEADETVVISLANPANAVLAPGATTATLTITDDDPQVSFSNVSFSVLENNVTVSLEVVLSVPTLIEVQVQYSTVAGNALAGTDFDPASGVIIFAPNTTSQLLGISVKEDADQEVQESFAVVLTNPTNAFLGFQSGATISIEDDDGQPTVALNPGTYTVIESAPTVSLTVTLSSTTVNIVSVDFTTSPGTALIGSDFIATSGTLSFGPNETSKTFSITIIDNADSESNETFGAALSNPDNASLDGAQSSATITIVDDDS